MEFFEPLSRMLSSINFFEIFDIQRLSSIQTVFIPIVIIIILISTGALVRDSFSKKSIGFFVTGLLFSLWIINNLIETTAVVPNFFWISKKISFLLESALFIIPLWVTHSMFSFSKKLKWFTIGNSVIFLIGLIFITQTPIYHHLSYVLKNSLYIYFFISTFIIGWYARRLAHFESDTETCSGNLLMIRSLAVLHGIFFFILFVESVYKISLLTQLFPLLLIGSVFYFGFKLAQKKFFTFSIYPSEVFVYASIGLITSLFIVPDNVSRIIIIIITIGILIFLTFFISQANKQQEEHRKILEKVNQQLITIDSNKNEFLSFATHQLRSPLTSFKWGLDVITDALKDAHDTKTIDIAQQLRTIADDMIDTVNNLLDISKIEQGGLVLNMEAIDLVDLLDKTSEEYRIIANSKQLGLLFVPEIPSASITGDKTKLRQLFSNIIDNAIKYTEKGTITITLNHSKEYYIITIIDTGVGISPQDIQKLFGKFSRGVAGKTTKGGSGLGLYLSKKIIELHHGTISAHSDGINMGSKFTIKIPIQH